MVAAAEVIDLVASVPDPELPFVTISDLGILRSVEVDRDRVRVCVTPTYSGCPATESIAADIRAVLEEHGLQAVVETVLSPAWTTDWLSERGRRALEEHGIAPPGRGAVFVGDLSAAGGAGATCAADKSGRDRVVCPHCRSADTEELTRFGSTACKALWRCRACREPFEHLKQH